MRASWLITIPLGALVVLFAVSNTEVVRLGLWPFDHTVDLPLSVAVLAVAAVAFLLGALVVWGTAVPVRMRARRLENSNTALRAELDELRRKLARTPSADQPATVLVTKR